MMDDSPVRLVDARSAAAQDQPGDAEHGNDATGNDEVIGHGMDPAGRIAEILADPQKKHRSDDGKLPGDDQDRVSQVAPLVQRLHLVGGQIALFRGKQGICHSSLLTVSADLSRQTVSTVDSITSGAGCASGATTRAGIKLALWLAIARSQIPANGPRLFPGEERQRSACSI